MVPWWSDFLSDKVNFMLNQGTATLVQRALHSHEGHLSSMGALVVKTGAFTGRAAEDKYVVRDEYSEKVIDWDNVRSLTQREFDNIKNEFVRNFNKENRSLYLMERSVGADPQYSLGIRLVTPRATHALFARNIFREALKEPELGHFTIFHCPDLDLNAKGLGLRSPTVIAINFISQEILIAGTGYAGEIKKAVFSVMNTILPDKGVLPLHSGANIDDDENVSIFLGLSGTGKTSLSTDEGKKLIGDDEHGLTMEGIFNIEGGCYAKTYQLTEKNEPQVYHAVNRFGAILENVIIDDNHNPHFDDKSITENGRASYPLSFIEDAFLDGRGPFPRNIFFLSADAMGVLPPLSKLTPDQAIYYFLSGYTAKLAGTEMGLPEIKATFSHCFGAPFMMRRPKDYAELLKSYMESSPINVWLVNTGWYGGPYGVGKRYDLAFTRQLVRKIQAGLPVETKFIPEKTFGLFLPNAIPGIDGKYLNPRELWPATKNYDQTAEKLKLLFKENFKKFSDVTFLAGHP